MERKPGGMLQQIIDRNFRIREELGFAYKIILGVIPIVLILLAWFLTTAGEPEERIINYLTLPSPSEVASQIGSLWIEKELTRSILTSAFRVLAAFGAALAVVLPLGILMGAFTRVRALFEPLMIFGAYLPIPALVPLTLSIFGTGEKQRIVFLAIAFGVFILPLIVRAISEVEETFLQTAQTLGASRWQIVRHVLIGVSLPQIYDAMRLGFGVGWAYIILAETIDAHRGLGHIINIAQRRGPREHIYLVLLIIVGLAFLTDKLMQRAGQKLFPYREQA